MPSIRFVSQSAAVCLLAVMIAACGGDETAGGDAAGRGGPGGPGGFPGAAGGAPAAAVPVELAPVERRAIAEYLETNGTLEAENEVDVVARTGGPIVALQAEEGQSVAEGQVLARIDDREIRAQLDIANVNLAEAEVAFERAQKSIDLSLISREAFDSARSTLESARAQAESTKLQLTYTVVRAPFSGLIVNRYVKFAEMVSNNSQLFRISDFDPLLCPIQVPERELSSIEKGQAAELTVEAFPGERFEAHVLRISPVVESATGTVKVTLAVNGRRKLSPGMFASIFLRTDVHEGVLSIPKAALVVESLGDTIYVAVDEDGTLKADRRDVQLGYRETDFVEVISGVEDGERVVVIGQDGLSDGTPIAELRGDGAAGRPPAERQGGAAGPPAAAGGAPGRSFDPSNLTADQLEAIKQRMRDRGLSDQQIEERLKEMRERRGAGGGGPAGTGGAPAQGGDGGGAP
jgi:membrane fusion protein (multidrug efflux system)